MKTIKIPGLITCLMVTVLSLAAFIGPDKVLTKKDIVRADGKGFVVLELFTSEGCSSCPPADDLLAKIEKEAKGKAVYLLAYHVDYWDRQGWKDIFSSADYSKRQVQYGSWLNTPQIYTPQLIINGKAEFVGSDEPVIRKAISAQLATKPTVTLALQAHQDNRGLKVQYQAAGVLKGGSLLLAIVQKSAQSKVGRGENAGRVLTHVQIVRKLQNEALSATGNGSVSVVLPKEFDNQNWEVLGLIQNKNNGEILGVAKADLGDVAAIKK